MTSAEKAKLYTAIGYSEIAVNHNLPKNVSCYCIFPHTVVQYRNPWCLPKERKIIQDNVQSPFFSLVLFVQFEDMKINFHMERMSVSMKDNKDQNEILKLTVEDLKSMLTQRPGAQAIK